MWQKLYVSVRRPGDANADGGVDLADLIAIVDAVAAGKP